MTFEVGAVVYSLLGQDHETYRVVANVPRNKFGVDTLLETERGSYVCVDSKYYEALHFAAGKSYRGKDAKSTVKIEQSGRHGAIGWLTLDNKPEKKIPWSATPEWRHLYEGVE